MMKSADRVLEAMMNHLLFKARWLDALTAGVIYFAIAYILVQIIRAA